MDGISIVSNVPGLARLVSEGGKFRFSAAARGGAFLRQCRQADLVILDDDQERLRLACLLRPFSRFRLVSVDLILRPPSGFKARLRANAKRRLLSQVDRFILYFKDTAGYERIYGIDPARTAYVPFKVNGWEQRSSWPSAVEGDYVLCAGRTLRDVATFVEAMRIAGCPGIILQQRRSLLTQHGTAAWAGELPPNLRLVTDESDSLERFMSYMANARIVVIPRFRGDIAATGISTYLMAMALGRCVILSRGPGAEDVLSDQAVLVSPENADELAQAISSLWRNADARSAIAARGKRYAEGLAGEQRLCSDILRASLGCLPAHYAPGCNSVAASGAP